FIEVAYQHTPARLSRGSIYRTTQQVHEIAPTRGLRPDLVIRRWRPGQSDQWLVVEVKGGAKEVERYARAAASDLLAYIQRSGNVVTENRKPYGLGIAWGADLAPATGEGIMLCTPDTLPDALTSLFA